MAIAYVNSSNGRAVSASSLTIASYVVASGSDKALIVPVECQTGDNITGVTFNTSESLTQYAKVNSTVASFYNYFYVLANPTATTANIVVSASGTRTIIAFPINYTGVDQTTPLEAYNSNIATSSSFTVSVTTLTDNAWLAGTFRQDAGGTQTAGANTTQRQTAAGDNGYRLYDSNGAKSPAGSYSLNVSFTASSLYCGFAVSIKPAGAAPTSQIKTWDAVTQANVKNFLDATNAQTKSWNGVANT